MPATPIKIPTSDGHSLVGTLYTPSLAPPTYGNTHKLPALILAPTFTATQTMGVQNWAQHFTAHLWMVVITFDARGFGESQDAAFTPLEALPAAQTADIQDVITFACTHPLIDANKLALWGSGLSGGHTLHVAAVDKRVRAVISQAPLVNGWETIARRVRHDALPELEARFSADRTRRCSATHDKWGDAIARNGHGGERGEGEGGEKGVAVTDPFYGGTEQVEMETGDEKRESRPAAPETVPIVCDPKAHRQLALGCRCRDEICALPGQDSWDHFSQFMPEASDKAKSAGWKNAVTLRSLEALRGYMPATLVDKISPTPLLMVVARDDRVCGADLALAAYERALQPKEVRLVDGGHYSVYEGEKFEGNVEGQIQWLRGVFGL